MMTSAICWTVLTIAVITQVTTGCPTVCECPAGPPAGPLACPPGVSVVPDGCGCCQVCAAQLNQDCGSTRPCDHHKGLECNYGNDVTMTWGICRAKSEGRSCEYSGGIYQNGESFRAGCKHQCTCMDGAVGCAPLCRNELPPPSPSCPYPRLVRIPGQCCFSVDCHQGTWHLPPTLQVPPLRHHHLPGAELHPAPRRPQNKLLLTNDLADVEPRRWESEHRGYKHVHAWNRAKETKCQVRTTNWSQCSRSCGTGVSSRITNGNPRCEPEKETRMCTVRPCRGLAAKAKRGKKCSLTQRAPEPIRLSYGRCTSVRLYRPNYCGVCTNGRCCSPRRTRTVPVTFVCPDGGRHQRSVMLILSCRCRKGNCGRLNEVETHGWFID